MCVRIIGDTSRVTRLRDKKNFATHSCSRDNSTSDLLHGKALGLIRREGMTRNILLVHILYTQRTNPRYEERPLGRMRNKPCGRERVTPALMGIRYYSLGLSRMGGILRRGEAGDPRDNI